MQSDPEKKMACGKEGRLTPAKAKQKIHAITTKYDCYDWRKLTEELSALLLTTHQEGEDKGKESAALTVESFGCDHLTCERDWCDDREKTLAEEIRKTKSGEGRG